MFQSSPPKISDPKAPRHLFKYQPISEYSIQNLSERVNWASTPDAFNDPFELQYHSINKNPKRDEIEKFLDEAHEIRILSFTQKHDNLLMWSHYADYHKGMCLIFEYPYLTYPVIYSDDFPSVDFTETEPSIRIIQFFNVLRTKSTHWSYEEERRQMFVPGTDPKVQYDTALKGVIFGMRTQEEHVKLVKETISNDTIDYFQAKPASGTFGLDIIQI